MATDADAVLAVLAERCPDLGLDDCEPIGARMRGVDATFAVRANQPERDRRHRVQLGAVTQLAQLDLLMELPLGLPVPVSALTLADRRRIKRLPPGCVDQTSDGYVRVIASPLDVRLAVVTKTQWQAGLIHTSRFAPYCNRALALRGEPKNLEQVAIEADFWGIGLIVNAERDPRLVVEPERYEKYRHTPAAWSFAEDIHRQVPERLDEAPGRVNT